MNISEYALDNGYVCIYIANNNKYKEGPGRFVKFLTIDDSDCQKSLENLVDLVRGDMACIIPLNLIKVYPDSNQEDQQKIHKLLLELEQRGKVKRYLEEKNYIAWVAKETKLPNEGYNKWLAQKINNNYIDNYDNGDKFLNTNLELLERLFSKYENLSHRTAQETQRLQPWDECAPPFSLQINTD